MYRRRRLIVVLLAVFSVLSGVLFQAAEDRQQTATLGANTAQTVQSSPALEALDTLEVKGRAPKTGYSRAQFSNDWGEINNCSLRELILKRDLENTVINEDGCRVMSGTLKSDPYTGKEIAFLRGPTSSQAVQIDHVVAVSDAWQKGAQQLNKEQRYNFYNDPLNLLAVDGPANNKKSDADAATWLPPNKDYLCRYVARQIAVKKKYALWVSEGEKSAIQLILESCPAQTLPQ